VCLFVCLFFIFSYSCVHMYDFIINKYWRGGQRGSTPALVFFVYVYVYVYYNLLSRSTVKSLNLNYPVSRTIHNSLARTVVKAPKSCHIPIITSILCSPLAQNHWTHLIQVHLSYGLTYKVLTITQTAHLHTSSLFNVPAIAVLALHPLLLLLGHRHYPL